MNRTDRVLHNPDRSCATYSFLHRACKNGKNNANLYMTAAVSGLDPPQGEEVPMPRPTKKKQRNSRGPSRFKRSEAARAARAVLDAGLTVERVDVDLQTGKFSVVVGKGVTVPPTADDEVESWLSKQQGHHANQR